MATTLQLECPGFWNEAVREKEEWHLKKGIIQIFYIFSKSGLPSAHDVPKKDKKSRPWPWKRSSEEKRGDGH